jgi:hypothetical protein
MRRLVLSVAWLGPEHWQHVCGLHALEYLRVMGLLLSQQLEEEGLEGSSDP